MSESGRFERGPVWTQADLVDRSHLDRSHVAKMEAVPVNASLRTVVRIASGPNVDIADDSVPTLNSAIDRTDEPGEVFLSQRLERSRALSGAAEIPYETD